MTRTRAPHGYRFRPIGTVRNDVVDPAEVEWDTLISRLELDPSLLPALEGIEAFSHLIVLFVFHRSPATPPPLQVRPERRDDMPLLGVFSTRSPRRPNPLGMTVVRLLAREGTCLTVQGLDALDGTPILDIKPYLLRGDRIAAPTVPGWLEQLWTTMDEDTQDDRTRSLPG